MNQTLIELINNIQPKANKAKKKDILSNNKLLLFLNETVLNDDETDYLFIGNESTVKGLIQLSGMCNMLNKFKESSKQILILIHKLISSGKQREVYADKFVIFDEQIKEHMKLDTYYSDSVYQPIILDIVYIIRLLRTSLTLFEIGVIDNAESIESKLSLKEKKVNKIKEDTQYVENMINKVADEIYYEPKTWVEVEGMNYNRKLLTLDFLNNDYNHSILLNQGGEMIIDEEQSTQNLLIETFIDPLSRLTEEKTRKLDFSKYGNASVTRNIEELNYNENNQVLNNNNTNTTNITNTSTLDQTKISQDKDKVTQTINNNSSEVIANNNNNNNLTHKTISMLELLHINNQNFDPAFFLETEYKNVSYNEFVEKIGVLEENLSELNTDEINTADKNLYKYLDCKKVIDNIINRYSSDSSKIMLSSKMELKQLEKEITNFLTPMRNSFEKIILAKTSKEIIWKYSKYFNMKEKIEQFLKFSNYELLADFLKKSLKEIKEISQTRSFDKDFYQYFTQTFNNTKDILIGIITESSSKEEIIKNFRCLLEIEVEFSILESIIEMLRDKFLKKVYGYLTLNNDSNSTEIGKMKSLFGGEYFSSMQDDNMLIDILTQSDKIDFNSLFDGKISLSSLTKNNNNSSNTNNENESYNEIEAYLRIEEDALGFYTIDEYNKIQSDSKRFSTNQFSNLTNSSYLTSTNYNNNTNNTKTNTITNNTNNVSNINPNILDINNFDRVKWPLKKHTLYDKVIDSHNDHILYNENNDNSNNLNKTLNKNPNTTIDKEQYVKLLDDYIPRIDSQRQLVSVEDTFKILVDEVKDFIFMIRVLEQNIKLKIQNFNSSSKYSITELIINLHTLFYSHIEKYLFLDIIKTNTNTNSTNNSTSICLIKYKIEHYLSKYNSFTTNTNTKTISFSFKNIITYYSDINNNILFKPCFKQDSFSKLSNYINEIFSLFEMNLTETLTSTDLISSKIKLIKSIFTSYLNNKTLIILLNFEDEFTTDYFQQHFTIQNQSCFVYFKEKLSLLYKEYKEIVSFYIEIMKITVIDVSVINPSIIFQSFFFNLKLLALKTLDFYETEAQMLSNSFEKMNLLILEFIKNLNLMKEESLVLARMLFKNKEEDYLEYYGEFQSFTQKIKSMFLDKFLIANSYSNLFSHMFSGLLTNVKFNIKNYCNNNSNDNNDCSNINTLFLNTMKYVINPNRNFIINISESYESYSNYILNKNVNVTEEDTQLNNDNNKNNNIKDKSKLKDIIFTDLRPNCLEASLYLIEIIKELNIVEIKSMQVGNPSYAFSEIIFNILVGFINISSLFIKMNNEQVIRELDYTDIMQLILEYQSIFALFEIEIETCSYNINNNNSNRKNDDNDNDNNNCKDTSFISQKLKIFLDELFNLAKEKKRQDGLRIDISKNDLMKKEWLIMEFSQKYFSYFYTFRKINLKQFKEEVVEKVLSIKNEKNDKNEDSCKIKELPEDANNTNTTNSVNNNSKYSKYAKYSNIPSSSVKNDVNDSTQDIRDKNIKDIMDSGINKNTQISNTSTDIKKKEISIKSKIVKPVLKATINKTNTNQSSIINKTKTLVKDGDENTEKKSEIVDNTDDINKETSDKYNNNEKGISADHFL